MASKILSFFKSFDFISSSPQLLAGKSIRIQTYVGSLFTLLISISIMYITWYFGKDIFFKNHVRLFVRDEQDIASYKHTLDSSNFFLGYYIADPVENIIEGYDKILSIEIAEFENRREKNNTKFMNFSYIEHQPTSCSNYRNPNNYFSNSQLKSLSCFDNMNFTLGGLWEEDYSRFLSIRMKY